MQVLLVFVQAFRHKAVELTQGMPYLVTIIIGSNGIIPADKARWQQGYNPVPVKGDIELRIPLQFSIDYVCTDTELMSPECQFTYVRCYGRETGSTGYRSLLNQPV